MSGPNTDPWGTPLSTLIQEELEPFTTTRIVRSVRKDSIHLSTVNLSILGLYQVTNANFHPFLRYFRI